MSTETHQAELLARWLSESPGDGVRPEPPSGLEADVVAAVSALRPDRAPAARLDIDDILFEVADGPLAEVVDPAAVGALGALLDEGGLPPGLDPDVLDAVSTLRPERAPAARVTIDDILAEVSSGPLSGMPSTTSPLPPSTPETMTPLASPANRGPTGKRPPAWLWRSLGGLAVAATALLFVVPMATQTMEAPPASDQAPRYKVAGAAQPMEESDRQTESVVELEAAVEDGFEGSAPVEQPLHAPLPAPPPPPAAAPKASVLWVQHPWSDRPVPERIHVRWRGDARGALGRRRCHVRGRSATRALRRSIDTELLPDAAPAPKGATAARDTYGSARGARPRPPPRQRNPSQPPSDSRRKRPSTQESRPTGAVPCAGARPARTGRESRSAQGPPQPRARRQTMRSSATPPTSPRRMTSRHCAQQPGWAAHRRRPGPSHRQPGKRWSAHGQPPMWRRRRLPWRHCSTQATRPSPRKRQECSPSPPHRRANRPRACRHRTGPRPSRGHPAARPWLLALQGDVLSRRGDLAGARESYRRAVAAR